MDDDTPRRQELTRFLKAKRARISPERVGLPRGTRRLTQGLRREEVATLAGVGITWYTWLEQGRPINPSRALLRRIAGVLRLDPADQDYLLKLSGTMAPEGFPSKEGIDPTIARLLEIYPAPAFVIDDLFDMLALNELAGLLYDLDPQGRSGSGPFSGNQLWQIFMNSARRSLYAEFDHDIPKIVALFRLTAALHIGEPRYEELVRQLNAGSPDFRRMWNSLDTAPPSTISLRMSHPVLGELCVESVRLPLMTTPVAMLVFVVPADDATRRAFTCHGGDSAL